MLPQPQPFFDLPDCGRCLGRRGWSTRNRDQPVTDRLIDCGINRRPDQKELLGPLAPMRKDNVSR